MNIEIPEAHVEAPEAYADGWAAGASAERARLVAIMDGPEAAERPATARKIAMTTDMSVEAAAAFIADLPAERPRPKIPSLAERHAAAGSGAGAELYDLGQTHPGAGGAAAVMHRAVRKVAGIEKMKEKK